VYSLQQAATQKQAQLLPCGVAALHAFFCSLAKATVQHIYFFADTQSQLNKKIKELHGSHYTGSKKANTASIKRYGPL